MTNEKKNNGYIINHDEQTITITKDYAKRSSVPGSKEFRELSKLHAAFPEYTIQRRTAVITADKQILYLRPPEEKEVLQARRILQGQSLRASLE